MRVLLAVLLVDDHPEMDNLLLELPGPPLGAAQAIEPADALTRKRAPARLQAAPPSVAPPSLSGREREVAILIARALTNDEIARTLHISPHTVATHIKRMYERLGFASRVEVTRYVLDHHLSDD